MQQLCHWPRGSLWICLLCIPGPFPLKPEPPLALLSTLKKRPKEAYSSLCQVKTQQESSSEEAESAYQTPGLLQPWSWLPRLQNWEKQTLLSARCVVIAAWTVTWFLYSVSQRWKFCVCYRLTERNAYNACACLSLTLFSPSASLTIGLLWTEVNVNV